MRRPPVRPGWHRVRGVSRRRRWAPCRQFWSAALRFLLLVTGLVGMGQAIAAGPTVAELLAICDRALAAGYTGVDAAACEWYAAPCACKLREPAGGALRWCVPDSEPIDVTARRVVAALRDASSRDAAAEAEVQGVLERLYPCAGPAD
jgi:hypothetical protein